MLNGSVLNRSTLNGAATSAVLVFASAAFSAEATVTAEGSFTQFATANISCSLEAYFAGTRQHFASWHPVGTSTTQFDGNRTLAGVGNWQGKLTLKATVLNTVYVEGAWEAAASLHMLPDAKLAEGAWSATADLAASSDQAVSARGGWSVAASWDAEEALRIAGASADWSAGFAAYAEPDLTSGGVITKSSTWPVSAGAQWSNNASLTNILIGDLLMVGTAELTPNASQRHGAKGDWTSGLTTHLYPTRVLLTTVAMSAGASFSADATHVIDGGTVNASARAIWTSHPTQYTWSTAAFTAVATLVGEASQQRAARGQWRGVGSFGGELTYVRPATADLTGTASWEAEGVRIALVSTDWLGAASTLISSAVLQLVPAPESRRFRLSDPNRNFVLSDPNRKFRLSGGRRKSKVTT